jgi:enterochelin esterase family protein
MRFRLVRERRRAACRLRVQTATIVGLSLSSLAAAFAVLQYSDRFRTAICQSPSLWWNDQWLNRSSGQPGPLARFWVSVGDRETDENVTHGPTGMVQKVSQIEGCRRMCELMRVRGIEVNEHTFAGGHDPDCWRDDLRLALPWSF